VSRVLAAVALSAVLSVAAVVVARAGVAATRSTPAAALRDLTAPFALPVLWARVGTAAREGRLAEEVAAGREILGYLPDWIDGHVHFAARLAFDLGLRADDAESAWRWLEAGCTWLESAAAAQRDRAPARAAELLAAAASFLEIRGRQDRALAVVARRATGRDPAEQALALLERAVALDAGRALADRRAFLTARVVAQALRTGDRGRALATLDMAVRLLAGATPDEASRGWSDALVRVRPLLEGKPVADLDALRDDPRLSEILEALEAR
jgi:hypothetical protein